MGTALHRICHVITRKKVIGADQNEENSERCGGGRWATSALGVGVYVIAGLVAQRVAGPAVLLTIFAAALAALFAGLCYAELRSRVPSARSAFTSASVCVGEFPAFLLGWTLIVEGIFGACVAARGLSLSVDWLAGHQVAEWMLVRVPMSSPYFAHYFDLLAFGLVLILGVSISCGARASVPIKNVLAGVNILVVIFIIIAGAIYADLLNWSIPAAEVPAEQFGSGGFFPFGAWGVLRGAALAFYGFIGYDEVTTIRVMKEPHRSVPVAILISLGVLLACYAGLVIVLTMMVPYYQIPGAAIAGVFSVVAPQWLPWIVGAGAVFGLCTSLFSVMSTLPQVIQTMASDWLLPPFLTRFWGSLLAGAIVAVLTGIFELELLLLMMCISTLLSYAIISSYVILLRFQPEVGLTNPVTHSDNSVSYKGRRPSCVTYTIVSICLGVFVAVCMSMALVVSLVADALIPAIVLHVVAAVLVIIITLQPRTNPDIVFKTPVMPLIPCLCIYVNINLMILVDLHSWIRVIICVLIGILIYIICACIRKDENKVNHLKGNLNEAFTLDHTDKNGKLPIHITVESPTPTNSLRSANNLRIIEQETDDNANFDNEVDKYSNLEMKYVNSDLKRENETKIQHAAIEYNEEKEAKIIDLLDQVLQAEEDSFGEISSLPEQNDEVGIMISASQGSLPHRKSLTELSDTGSEVSLGDTRHDVVAQVHREDLPILDEDSAEEQKRKSSVDIEDDEQVTYFGMRETNSPTDESGYSDSTENMPDSNESTDHRPWIPTPPPMPSHQPIPIPPPFEDFLLATSPFKKSFTTPARPSKSKSEIEAEKPRESLQSNSSYGDTGMVFGSPRQMSFMSKLNNIYQNKMEITDISDQKTRSKSVEDVLSNFPNIDQNRAALFFDLKKELLDRETTQILRPVAVKEDMQDDKVEKEENEDLSLNREDLKSKLEVLLSTGGPVLMKPRLMKANLPTPDDVTPDTSLENALSRISDKKDKNDTLKLQKAQFGEVLNSFRMSFNQDDVV